MSNPIRVGLIGVGRAGWGMHTEELEPRKDKFRYVAACDLIPERRERMAERFGCKAYENWRDLIADPEVELVCVATRSIDHFEHAEAALQAGKDVLAEKPLAVTYAQALRLKELSGCADCGTLYVRHNRRFEPNFEYARDLIASGLLGRVYEIRLARNGYQRRDDWQTISEYAGGQMLNWGPHLVDHALRFLDSPLRRLYSHLEHAVAAGDCEDHVKLLFEGENDRVIDVEISGGMALPVPEYLIYGTKGAASIEKNTATLRYIDPEQTLPEPVANPGTPMEQSFGQTNTFAAVVTPNWIEREEPIPQHPLDTIWDHLYASIREGKPFPITLDEAVEVIRVIHMAKSESRFPVCAK